MLITDGNLEVMDEGIEYIVRAEKSLLDGLDSTRLLQLHWHSNQGQSQNGRMVHQSTWQGLQTSSEYW